MNDFISFHRISQDNDVLKYFLFLLVSKMFQQFLLYTSEETAISFLNNLLVEQALSVIVHRKGASSP